MLSWMMGFMEEGFVVMDDANSLNNIFNGGRIVVVDDGGRMYCCG